MHTLYTLGHRQRSLEEFLAMVNSVAAAAVVDMRAQPQMEDDPAFDDQGLRVCLENAGVQYHWAGRQLAGPRTLRANSHHRALGSDLRGYADYMETDVFRRGAAQLVQMAAKSPIILLSCAREPDGDFRSLLSDYLCLQGVEVVHLLNPGETREHQLSAAVRRESQELVYDRQT